MGVCMGLCRGGGGEGRGVLRELDFFLLRTALRDRPKGPPTANHQPPATTNRQPPPTASRQPPTANRQSPPTGNRQSPPTMVEHMSYTLSFCKTAVQEHFFFPVKDPPAESMPASTPLHPVHLQQTERRLGLLSSS